VVLADAAGAPLGGQLGLILAWDRAQPPDGNWAAFLCARASSTGTMGSGTGTRARELAKEGLPWSAWYCYEAARSLLVPVDFLSSPNLEKLGGEQAQIKNSPLDAFPLLASRRSAHLEDRRGAAGHHAAPGRPGRDLRIDGSDRSGGVAHRGVAVLSALLKAQPGLRENFHGLWAYAVKDGKRTPVIELPMAQIP
jgi:hypothetical protein